ncbi:rhomboid-like protein [Streptomyces sp. NPDC052051]|uniref:rhomboid-like protein n=1 Tax=Streptomyces sp. NPDC052051 TaxID=3154649 RepID=UPI003440ED2C
MKRGIRFRRLPGAAAAYVRSAPGTYLWLLLLCLTTVALRHMPPGVAEHFLRRRSTNLHELSSHPVRALIASAMWIEGGYVLPYAVLYTVFHAQAERWLGTVRWLVVCLAAHVLATLASEGALLLAIRDGSAPRSAFNALDIGVSYALAGVVAVLTYRIASPWRYVYLAGVLLVYGTPFALAPDFTKFGHLVSAVIGLACRPLVVGRGRPWNPKETLAALRS